MCSENASTALVLALCHRVFCHFGEFSLEKLRIVTGLNVQIDRRRGQVDTDERGKKSGYKSAFICVPDRL